MAKNTRLRIKENGQFEVYHPETNLDQVLDNKGMTLTNILVETLNSAKSHTTSSIAALVGSAPETLDTLKEIATAIQATDGAVNGLITSIAAKVNTVDFTAHTTTAATTAVLGHVKVGTNIAVSGGTVSVANGTTTAKGVVQLTDAVNSTSTTTAATPRSVKEAYDASSSKYVKPAGGIPRSDLSTDVIKYLDGGNDGLINGPTTDLTYLRLMGVI